MSENIETARRYIQRLSEGATAEEFGDFLAPDIEQQEFPNRLVPNGATRNLDAIKEGRRRGQALLREEHFEIVNIFGSGRNVVAEVIWTGTVRDQVGPFAAGQQLRARFAVFMEFEKGRIVRQRNYDCFDPW